MYFELISGKHCDGDKVYKKGDVVRSAMDLVSLFPNKFTKLNKMDDDERPQDSPRIPEPASDKKILSRKEETSSEAGEGDFGEDVTDAFPLAKDGGFLVYKNDEGYIVIDAEDNKPLNRKRVPVNKVKVILKKYIES